MYIKRMVDVSTYANLCRFTAILPATTPTEKSRVSFEVSAEEQPVIPFLCDMASYHEDKMSNKKFCLDIYIL